MALKKIHKGIEGYFYRCGNKKLEVQPGLIDKAGYSKVDGQRVFNLYISKPAHTSFTFEISDPRDVSSLLEDFQVSNARELNALSVQERLVLVYNNDGVNYGISCDKRGKVYQQLRI